MMIEIVTAVRKLNHYKYIIILYDIIILYCYHNILYYYY